MVTPDNLVDAVEIIARNEDATRELYLAYAERFPEYRSFWMRIADEELVHARWARGLERPVREGTVQFHERLFHPETYATLHRYVLEKVTEARAGQITLIGALSVASDIEGTLVECAFEQIFECSHSEIARTLQRLSEDSRNHRAAIDRRLAEQHALQRARS